MSTQGGVEALGRAPGCPRPAASASRSARIASMLAVAVVQPLGQGPRDDPLERRRHPGAQGGHRLGARGSRMAADPLVVGLARERRAGR